MEHDIKDFNFGLKHEKAWHLSHKIDPVMGVSVTPNSGDFLLFLEGFPCGVCIPGEDVKKVILEQNGDDFVVKVEYVGRKGEKDQYDSSIMIGRSSDARLLPEACRFVESLNQAFFRK